ncbi:MAG TPA: PDZ domain-containing protein [Gemmatimonadales bacterium]|nr:PDZ domain-containing protein [Gemmatimonadales bacterium]
MRRMVFTALALAVGLGVGAQTAAAQQPVSPKDRAEMERKLADLQRQMNNLKRQLGDTGSGESRFFTAPDVRVFTTVPDVAYSVFGTNRGRIGVIVRADSEPGTDSIGAVVQAVTPGGPADDAGLKPGDVITVFNGTRLVGHADQTPGAVLIDEAQKLDPGDTVRVTYRRDGATKTATLVAHDINGFMYRFDPRVADSALRFSMREFAKQRVMDSAMTRAMQRSREARDRARVIQLDRSGPNMLFRIGERWSDMELTSLNPQLGSYFGTSHGLLVVRAPRDSSLELKGGDVILKIGDRVPESPAHAMRIFASYQAGEKIQLEILRQKKHMTITATVPDGDTGMLWKSEDDGRP